MQASAMPNAAVSKDPIVVLAADENFAIPLAVTVRSAIENLAADRRLRIFVLDGGIRPATRQRLEASWPAGRFEVTWVTVDASALQGLPASGHINLVSYYRILIPRVLPQSIPRVIYLDADLIVRQDLGQLWDSDLAGHYCLAAQDVSAPYLDSSVALANYDRCGALLSSTNPLPNFRELGLSPRAPYFNAGVLLIDLDAWRQAEITRRSLECLDVHRQHVLWWDQYALNVVLAGHWGVLDACWNQGSHAHAYPSWDQSPLDQISFERLRSQPYIVHFTTRDKPWQPLCRHPFRAEFFAYLDRTLWAGWRPSRIKLMLELLKVQERRLRRGRKWLKSQVSARLQRTQTRRAASTKIPKVRSHQVEISADPVHDL